MADLSRLSFNQITTPKWGVREAVDGCVRRGIPSIALWRHKIAEAGLDACVRMVRDAGLGVSSVCRGGMFPAATAEERARRIEDNFRAVDEAAALGADSLVLVVGGAQETGIIEARKMVADGVVQLAPYAAQCGVRLGLEPLHPMFAADRSVLVTIDQAREMASAYSSDVAGVILDVFHIWWDPMIAEAIARCEGRIYGFHVSDWLVPLPDVLLGRGMMGDGVIDNRGLREMVDGAGYSGAIEVEIFNQAIWDADPDEVLDRVVAGFMEQV